MKLLYSALLLCLVFFSKPYATFFPLAQTSLASYAPAATMLAGSGANVLTQHNDNYRAGANLNETALNTATVNALRFGKLFSRAVDGYIYAQPLYVAQVNIPGQGARNVVYVATEHNSVYAFDADAADAKAPLWQVNLGAPVPSTDIDPDYHDLTPEIGITSTPVIDPGSQTIYVVAKSKDASNAYHQKLHALDLATGQNRMGSPVEISAQVQGIGLGNANGTISFDPLLNLNRPGLLLLNGAVYLAFGSHGDIGDYHGWVLGYDAKTLAQVAVFCPTPDGKEAAIWMSGQGLAADENNNIYFVTSNGTFSAQNGGRDYGDSALKLSTNGGLSVVDSFTPHNQDVLSEIDADLGAGGPVLLPGVNRLVFAGKDTVFRVLDTNNLGGFDPQTDRIVQQFQASMDSALGAPVYWNSPNNGPVIYYWGAGDYLKVFKLIGGQFETSPASQSTVAGLIGISNSPPMSLSANGSNAGSGILWATSPVEGNANDETVSGILRAFDAADVSKELWNSKQNADRDDIGSFAKFCPPTVANGKVYVATFSGQLQVFGLLPAACNVSIGQTSQLVTAGADGGSVNVLAGTDCNWLAASNNDWIKITSGAEGSGNGTVNFSVAPNPSGNMRSGTINIAGVGFTVTQAGLATMVSAASYEGAPLAGESIAVAFGANLATGTASAGASLPTTLAGATITVTDGTGAKQLAPLFFASPNQINYLVPSGLALGTALFTITSEGGNIATNAVQIARVAPGIFSANATGQGLAAAVVLRVKADGTQTYEPVGQFDPAQNRFTALPIDLGPDMGNASDQVFLILFGTGLRNRTSPANVKTQVGGVDLPPAFAGAQGNLFGVDQINLQLPRSLAGRGSVDVVVTVEGLNANGVSIAIK